MAGRRRWWRLSGAIALPGLLAGLLWLALPLALSPTHTRAALDEIAARSGLQLQLDAPARRIFDPLPVVALDGLRLSNPDGSVSLTASEAWFRPSLTGLLPGAHQTGTLVLKDARLVAAASGLRPGLRLAGITARVHLARDGSARVRFDAPHDDAPLTGHIEIGNLAALAGEKVSRVAWSLSDPTFSAAFAGIMQQMGVGLLPRTVGKLSLDLADGATLATLGVPGAGAFAGGEVSTHVQLNATPERLSFAARVVAARQGRSVVGEITLDGKDDWQTHRTLETRATVRVGGLLTAQVTGDVDWHAPLATPVSGRGTLAILDVPGLAAWLGAAPESLGPLPPTARLAGTFEAGREAAGFRQAELIHDGGTLSGEVMVDFAAARPRVMLASALPAIDLGEAADIPDWADAAHRLAAQPFDTSAKLSIGTVRAGGLAAQQTIWALETRPGLAELALKQASTLKGKVTGLLSLDLLADRADLSLSLARIALGPLTEDRLTGRAAGSVTLAWQGDAPALAKATGQAYLSIYAGRFRDIELGAQLSGTALDAGSGATQFAVLAGQANLADGALSIPDLRLSGIGWRATGNAEVNLATRRIRAGLETRQTGGPRRHHVAVSGSVEAPDLTIKALAVQPDNSEPPPVLPGTAPVTTSPPTPTVPTVPTNPPDTSGPEVGALRNTDAVPQPTPRPALR